MNADRYTYKVRRDKKTGEYVGRCLEFPDLWASDKTKDGALEGILDLVRDEMDLRRHIKKERVPEPLGPNPDSYTYMFTWSPMKGKFFFHCPEFPELDFYHENKFIGVTAFITMVQEEVYRREREGLPLPPPMYRADLFRRMSNA